jgi:hypothetical protein
VSRRRTAVDVGAGIGGAVSHLFGRQVGGGADQRRRRGGDGARGDRAGESEVGDLDPAVGCDEDVLGLDVAVHEPGRVSGGEGGEHVVHDRDGFRGGEPAAATKNAAQRLSGDVLHDEERVATVGALVVDRDDVRVVERGSGSRLAGEAGDELRVVGKAGVHDLDRDPTVEAGVGREVDAGHPAAGDAAANRVSPVEEPIDHRVAQRRIHRTESRC